MIKIDLTLLEKLKININEYLTILKIDQIGKDSDIPFNTESIYLDSLEEKGYLESIDETIKLTSKAKRHFKINSIEDDITEIIEYFKKVTNKTKISVTSISNRRYIKDRLRQGYGKDDLKKVIDNKYTEWKDNRSMSMYIRIETLFNQEKFQKYIGEIEPIIKEDSKDSFSNYTRI